MTGNFRPASRRTVLLGLASLPLFAAQALADPVIDLNWPDLIPADGTALPEMLSGIVPHGAADTAAQTEVTPGVRNDWDGKIVRIPGFVVPLDYQGTGVTQFILVPYVGACIHVPPPPANQLIFVTTEKPYESSGLFEAVTVTGMFGTAATSTQLADIGYALSADRIEPYRY
jgi:hypothetical protein